MLCTPRTLLRGMADARLWAAVLLWWSDQPSGRWWTLAEIEPQVPVAIEPLSWLLNAWLDEGWVERRTDSGGRTLWRPTVEMPIVTPRQRPATQSWSDLFSAVAELPVRWPSQCSVQPTRRGSSPTPTPTPSKERRAPGNTEALRKK